MIANTPSRPVYVRLFDCDTYAENHCLRCGYSGALFTFKDEFVTACPYCLVARITALKREVSVLPPELVTIQNEARREVDQQSLRAESDSVTNGQTADSDRIVQAEAVSQSRRGNTMVLLTAVAGSLLVGVVISFLTAENGWGHDFAAWACVWITCIACWTGVKRAVLSFEDGAWQVAWSVEIQTVLVSALIATLAVPAGSSGTIQPPFLLAICSITLLLAGGGSDYLTGIVPDEVTLLGSVALVSGAAMYSTAALMEALVGAAVGFGIIAATAWLFSRLYQRECIGGGAMKMALLMGAAVGWQGFLGSIFLASIAGTAVSLLRKRLPAARGPYKTGHLVPFGFLMAAAGIIWFFVGDDLLAWYWNLIVDE